jgi:3-methyladenine DNA glycosylase AlkD
LTNATKLGAIEARLFSIANVIRITVDTVMTLEEVMRQLESLGTAQTVKTFRNHGAQGEMFGVKVGDMKKVLKHVKGDQELAMQLWDTNNSDAMYLAALAADGSQMTRPQLDRWVQSAWWYMLSECAVPFVAAEHPQAIDLAKKWMRSTKESIAACGWSTYTLVVSIRPDEELDLDDIRGCLKMVETKIPVAANRVRLCMNGFVIGVGSFVKPLLRDAKATAKRIGNVDVDMGKTSCKVPNATEYIQKVETMGRVGKKRKMTKC